MWNRADIKIRGMFAFKNNYWNSVLVAFIYSIFFLASSSTYRSKQEQIKERFENDPEAARLLVTILAVLGAVIAIVIVVKILVINPLEVGCCRFFLLNQEGRPQAGVIGYGYSQNYMNNVLGIFLKDLFIGLGYLAFVIPGVILSYSFRLVPYILAENPDISGPDALRKSREMMQGQKMNCFIYDWSFILWNILVIFTCGIAGLFYVRPYKMNADAVLYQAIKAETANPNAYDQYVNF
jgi:uncharacterized membrane protein